MYRTEHLKTLETGDERMRQLTTTLSPFIDRRFHLVTQRDVATSLAEWSGATFNRRRSAVLHLFAWAREREITALRPEIKPKREKSRDDVLTLDQIRALYAAAENRGAWKGFCRLLILTGQRRGEVAGMRKQHIEGEIWAQPSSKNGMPHIVHLTPRAQKCLEKGITWAGKTTFSDMKKRWFSDADISHDFRMHDIRRTFATTLADAGASEAVVDRALNHVASASARGVARVYNRASMLKQRRELMFQYDEILFGGANND